MLELICLYTLLVIFIILIGVAALIATLYAGKQVNNTIKVIDEADPEVHEELLKANYYKNPKSNFSIMIIIYIILFCMFIFGFAAYRLFFS